MDIYDFMFDFETIGTSPDSVVLSLAFIPFERNSLHEFKHYVNRARYWKFHLNQQLADGRKIEENTLQWWEKQDPEVKKSQFDPSRFDVTLPQMLKELQKVVEGCGIDNRSMGYCRGQSFDFPIMADIVRKHGRQNPAFFPCAFWNQVDVRSYIKGLIGDVTQSRVPLPSGSLEGFKHHDPVDDCARAILHVKYAEAYAMGEIEVPEDVDPNSFK